MLDDNLFATQKDEMGYSDVVFNILAWKEPVLTQEAMCPCQMANANALMATGPHAWTTAIDKQSRPHVVSIC